MFNKNQTYEQHDNEKISFYRSSVEDLNSQDQLTSDIDVDICVIGGGLTGISSAINLSKKGYSVILCEARKIGWGASGRNGGQLGIGMRKDQFTIEKKLGLRHAKELWSLGLEAVEDVKNLIKENEIDCHLVNELCLPHVLRKISMSINLRLNIWLKIMILKDISFLIKKRLEKK